MKKVYLLFLVLILYTLLGKAGDILFYLFTLSFYVFATKKRIFSSINILLIPVFVAFVIGFFFQHYTSYEVFKDFFYLASPIVMLLFGEVMASNSSEKTILKATILFGSIVACYICWCYISAYGFRVLIDPREVRETEDDAIYFSSLPLVTYSLLLYRLLYTEIKEKYKYLILAVISLLSVYVTGSRSNLLVILLISFCFLMPLYKRNRKLFIRILIIVVLSLTVFLSFSGENKLIQRFEIAGTEMKVGNYRSAASRNQSYRGYEAFMAMRQFSKYDNLGQLLGGGMGATVDMGPSSPVGIRHIPMLHNGYPYLLIKLGWIGSLIFLGFFVWLFIRFWNKRGLKAAPSFWRLLALSGIASVFFLQLSVNAFFNRGYNVFLIYIGIALYYSVSKKSCRSLSS